MLKKVWILIPTICSLASCSTPPKYVLSDEDAYKIEFQRLAMGHCSDKNKAKFGKLLESADIPSSEGTVFSNAFLYEIYRSVIGDNGLYWLANDRSSYAIAHSKLSPQISLLAKQQTQKLTKEQCKAYENFLAGFIKKWKSTKAQQKAEEKARQEFYATPQGQAYLAQQQLTVQQQQMQQQMINQMQMMQEQQQWNQINQQINNNRVKFTNCYGVMNGVNCMSY